MAEAAPVTAPKRRKRPSLECGHCGEVVSKSTYYRHKQKFYNPATKKWKLCDQQDSESSSGEDCGSYEEGSEISEWKETVLDVEMNSEFSEVVPAARDRKST